MSNFRNDTNTNPAPLIGYKAYEDTNFVSGDSPVEHNFWDDAGKIATDGAFHNDGTGSLTFAIRHKATDAYGDEITLKRGETFSLTGLAIYSVRVTWVADTAYRLHLK